MSEPTLSMNELPLEEENNSIEVTEGISLGDLSGVDTSGPNVIIEPQKGVLVYVNNVSVKENKAKTHKTLNVSVKLVEGIEIDGEMKYQNKVLFGENTMFISYVEGEKEGDYWTGPKKKYLSSATAFLKACDVDLSDVVINDELLTSLIGKQLRCDIIKESVQRFNESTGKYEDVPGEYRNVVKYFRAV